MWLTRKSKLKRPEHTRDVLTYLRKLQAGDLDGARALLPDSLRSAVPRSTPLTIAVPESVTAPKIAANVSPLATVTSPMAVAQESIALTPSIAHEPSNSRGEAELDGDDVPARPRRWPWLVAAVAVIAAIVALIAWPRGSGERAAAVATAPIDAGAAVDATELAVLPIVDAAAPPLVVDAADRNGSTVVRATPTDAAPAVVRTVPVDAAPAVVRAVPVDAAPAATTPPPDVEGLSLKALYGQVARQLDDAVARLGADRTAALRQRFAAVPPYPDAVRKPALRTDAEAQLKALSRELAKLR